MTAAPVCPCAAWTEPRAHRLRSLSSSHCGVGRVFPLLCPPCVSCFRAFPASSGRRPLPPCVRNPRRRVSRCRCSSTRGAGGRGRVSEQAGTARPVFPGASSEAEGPPGARPLELAASAPPSLVLLWASAPLSGGGGGRGGHTRQAPGGSKTRKEVCEGGLEHGRNTTDTGCDY